MLRPGLIVGYDLTTVGCLCRWELVDRDRLGDWHSRCVAVCARHTFLVNSEYHLSPGSIVFDPLCAELEECFGSHGQGN